MIKRKEFDPSLMKLDKKSNKNIGIYYIGYITIKDSDHVKINSVNPLYRIAGQKVLVKYTKLWDEIKYHIQTINSGKSGECKKDYMRIKFNSDDDLPLNKILKLHNLTIIVRSVFEEDGKYYPQAFLDECLYEV